jgi:hypothetical protein
MVNEKISNEKVSEKVSNAEQYFEANKKFFATGDINGKKACFTLGMYCRKVMELAEKHIAEAGKEDKFEKQLSRLVTSNMTYRVFSSMAKLLDDMALRCNSKLFQQCSGQCKQYLINSDFVTDKKALSAEDANTAFSLGLYQKF